METAGLLEDLRKLNAELEGNEDLRRKNGVERTRYSSVVSERSTDLRRPGSRPSPRHATAGTHRVGSSVGNNKRRKFVSALDSESSLETALIQDEVDNFIVHSQAKLVSFTTLPVYIDGVPAWGATRDWAAIPPEEVFVEGTVDADGEMFKERVEMWRPILHPTLRPQFLLKTKKGAWIRLLNPREDYSKIMSDVHVLGHFLNFVKKLPNASKTAAEQDLQKMCRTHGSRPTLNTLSQHIEVIKGFIQEDDKFAEAPVLRRIFPNLFPNKSSPEKDESYDSEYDSESESDTAGVKLKAGRLPLKSESTEKKEKVTGKVTGKKYFQKPKSSKLSGSPELYCDSDHPRDHRARHNLKVGRNLQDVEFKPSEGLHRNDVSATEDDIISKDAHRSIFTQAEKDVEDPPICVLCDDGGDLLYCDGPCHRHFHHTKASGVDSSCATLELSEAEVKAMGKYYCPNCKHGQQQCFGCGELGSSVATASDPPEVRCCEIPFCHKFFHADCVAARLSSSGRDWRDLADAINGGRKKLYCPRHCCSVCGRTENKEPGLLVQCRRCPKAWHRKCLLDFSLSKEVETTLIWKHDDRGFIYCRNHKVIPELQTPARTHVIFPDA